MEILLCFDIILSLGYKKPWCMKSGNILCMQVISLTPVMKSKHIGIGCVLSKHECGTWFCLYSHRGSCQPVPDRKYGEIRVTTEKGQGQQSIPNIQLTCGSQIMPVHCTVCVYCPSKIELNQGTDYPIPKPLRSVLESLFHTNKWMQCHAVEMASILVLI